MANVVVRVFYWGINLAVEFAKASPLTSDIPVIVLFDITYF
ncbi:hypothetical protein THF1C08_10620 [Vibrio jasicida]|uniref:Uncharacterized protein n=1 Tax=Vibrio jasicida TaxID=766224 RepID=A0AAU9QF45_9VIBR|nr:hypothetical protein THF1C08_10620 [Vibrio jasicida]CAH1567736.1 hypothetical protein THF1A12_10622 [Vibrio jasicida]